MDGRGKMTDGRSRGTGLRRVGDLRGECVKKTL